MLLEMSRAVVKNDPSPSSPVTTSNVTSLIQSSRSEDITYQAGVGSYRDAIAHHQNINDCSTASVGVKGILSAVSASSSGATCASNYEDISTGRNYSTHQDRNSYTVPSNGSVILEEAELWDKFYECQNEMIVTKCGRRMFPVVQVNVQGLEPNSMYSLVLEFSQLGSGRWKYVSGKWTSSGKAEPAPREGTLYVHPDSPNFGNFWMKGPVNFGRVKLTNKTNPPQGQIVLNSLHKYQPIVHVVGVQPGVHLGETPPIMSATFPQTQFIAVTAYQNEEITALKVTHNPYAKAFQESRDRSEGYMSSTGSYVGSGNTMTNNPRSNRNTPSNSNESQSYDSHQNIYCHRNETQSPTNLTNRTAYPTNTTSRHQQPPTGSWFISPVASSPPFYPPGSSSNSNMIVPEINLTSSGGSPSSHNTKVSSNAPLHRVLGPYPQRLVKRGSPECNQSPYHQCSQASSPCVSINEASNTPTRVTPDSPECHEVSDSPEAQENTNFTSCSFASSPSTITSSSAVAHSDNYSSYVTDSTNTEISSGWSPSTLHHPFGPFHHHPLHHYSPQGAAGAGHLHHQIQINPWGFAEDTIRPHPALLYGVFATRNASSTGAAQTVLANARDYFQSDSTGSVCEGDSPPNPSSLQESTHSTQSRSQNQWSPISPGSSGS